ncbi:hypothetical protein ON058_10870 [Demequina sp. B12]|uniref:hypothetical protein n=1 Tax=Demequina sp. B12 TaxID=2992757 RepID=UPI00237B019C|nr:hypothetical protein [Demequina sp. B12]MDE0573913.1 hypothetical protein [Demequina sp. B12]
MKKFRKTAVLGGALALAILGSAPASAAADSGWLVYDSCPYVDGCGIISELYSSGANSRDGGCAGSIGQKIKYSEGGTNWISGITWKATRVYQSHSNTFAYKVYH